MIAVYSLTSDKFEDLLSINCLLALRCLNGATYVPILLRNSSSRDLVLLTSGIRISMLIENAGSDSSSKR